MMDGMMFRFPEGTRERIRNLAQVREPYTSVILRALDALESAKSAAPTITQLDVIAARVDRLESLVLGDTVR